MSSLQCDVDVATVQGPVLKQRRLGEVVGAAAKADSVQPVLDAIVKHAFEATSGERELFQMIDVDSNFTQSIYDDRLTAKGETTIYQVPRPL